MEKLFSLLLCAILLCSCQKIDKRDRYVGEYRLYETTIEDISYYSRMQEKVVMNREGKIMSLPEPPAASMHSYQDFRTDSTQKLIVRKLVSDTISLVFTIVKPFDFENQRRIIAINEESKKWNEQSICGPDKPMIRVPKPTCPDSLDFVVSYNAYVSGHKIFLRDDRQTGKSVKFDSVYLLNDTMHFKVFTNEYSVQDDEYFIHRRSVNRKQWFYGVKIK